MRGFVTSLILPPAACDTISAAASRSNQYPLTTAPVPRGSVRSCVRWSTPPPTRCWCSPSSRLLSLSLPPTIDCLPCFLDPGHVVFSDNDRDYFARSLDCRRIHSVACRSLQTPTQSAESLPVSVVLPGLRSSADP